MKRRDKYRYHRTYVGEIEWAARKAIAHHRDGNAGAAAKYESYLDAVTCARKQRHPIPDRPAEQQTTSMSNR